MPYLAFVLAVLFSFSAHAQLDVDALNQQLKAENAGWVARDNQIQHLIGGHEVVPYVRDAESELDASVASSLDWRNHRGSNWVGSVRDQGQCGSCVAFAAIATLEVQYRIDTRKPSLPIKLSPQHLFSCGGGSCWWGWTPDAASSYLVNNGVPDEACYPYESGRAENSGSCSRTCSDYRKRVVRLKSVRRPTRGSININAIRAGLQRGPLVATMNVYEDFQYYSSGIYKHVSGRLVSGHAVSIVGYNDNGRYFIVRNSWGSGWGERGFAKVSYEDTSALGGSTWGYQPEIN